MLEKDGSKIQPELRAHHSRRRRLALSSRPLRLCWNLGSFLRLLMCSEMAARMTSDTGNASTFATVSNASACSADRRTVMALVGFMAKVCTIDTWVVKYIDFVVY